MRYFGDGGNWRDGIVELVAAVTLAVELVETVALVEESKEEELEEVGMLLPDRGMPERGWMAGREVERATRTRTMHTRIEETCIIMLQFFADTKWHKCNVLL